MCMLTLCTSPSFSLSLSLHLPPFVSHSHPRFLCISCHFCLHLIFFLHFASRNERVITQTEKNYHCIKSNEEKKSQKESRKNWNMSRVFVSAAWNPPTIYKPTTDNNVNMHIAQPTPKTEFMQIESVFEMECALLYSRKNAANFPMLLTSKVNANH